MASLNRLVIARSYAASGSAITAARPARWVDAHDWIVAAFFQHDSRDHDPQLHIHNAILNRVRGADGEWRTLDDRALYTLRGAAAAGAERTTEEHLTRALGCGLPPRIAVAALSDRLFNRD